MGDSSPETNPRIYVACLAAYNSGRLHGAWIDATRGEDHIWNEVKGMLARSPIAGAEEWAIHDYEGFGSLKLSEWEGFEQVSEKASFVSENGELGRVLLAHFGGDVSEAKEAIEDRYHGCFSSLADHMQALTEETTEIPQSLRYYIDYEAMARDAEMSGDVFTVQLSHDEVHVFSGH